MDTKVCSECKSVKLLDAFKKRHDCKTGYRKQCKTCVREIQAKYSASNLEKLKDYATGYREANPDKEKERHAKYRKANLEKIKLQSLKYYLSNSEKVKERQSKYRAANLEKCRDRTSKWAQENPEKCRAKDAKRRAVKLLAIPSWLTSKEYKTMEAIYKESDRLTQETGIKHHVDHIHPLQGKLVCGFHCPQNLQILTESQNCSKGNRFTPYVESEI